jgi:Icc-related predicted phosphoesterase
MKILLVSDLESPYIWDHFEPERFRDIGLTISCGDLKAEYLSFLVTMINAPLFYVHGNHDGNYMQCPPEGCDCIDGKLVMYNGIRILGLGGSKRYNPGEFQYTDGEMEKRIRKLTSRILMNRGFDILVSHAGGLGIGDDTDLCHEGFKSFNKILDKYSPPYFIHGHVHMDYGKKERIVRYRDTTVINAYGYYILEYS